MIMNVLILNASPRKKGTIATLLRATVQGVKQAGHTTEWVDVYDLSIKPCSACMRCRPDGTCVLPADDAQAIGRKIQAADGLIVGTPTHWGNMSAPLKCLFDRNVPIFMRESPRGLPIPRHKGKSAVIVTACTTPWPFNVIFAQSRGAIRAVKEILAYGGYTITAKVVKPGTKNRPQVTEKEITAAANAGRRLANTISCNPKSVNVPLKD
jgi:multimeric flavodoxin WrbA